MIVLNAFIFPFDVYFFLIRRFEVTIVFAAPKSFGFRPVTLIIMLCIKISTDYSITGLCTN